MHLISSHCHLLPNPMHLISSHCLLFSYNSRWVVARGLWVKHSHGNPVGMSKQCLLPPQLVYTLPLLTFSQVASCCVLHSLLALA